MLRIRILQSLALLGLAVMMAGCGVTGWFGEAAAGRRVYASMYAASVKAVEDIKDAVVLVKIYRGSSQRTSSLSIPGMNVTPRRPSGGPNVTGLMLTADGYALVPRKVKPDDVSRIEVWIGDQEYKARVVKADEQLGMTIIKVDVDEPVAAINMKSAVDVKTGQWCVAVQPSDKDYDYIKFISQAYCRGEVTGLYREFLLEPSQSITPGSPIVGLSGQIAGILHADGRVLAINDIREDLAALLDDARGVKSADEEAKQKTWFGAMLSPINEDYARKHGLSKSGIWIRHVIKGGPAEEAGVKTGDLVIRVNGHDMRLTGERSVNFFRKALRKKVDTPFTVTVVRDGKEITLAGKFTKKDESETVRADDLGVTVQGIKDGDVATGNLFTDEGVYITEIKRGSAASVGSSMRQGLLNRGDIITGLGGIPTPDLGAFSTVLERLRREQPPIVLVSYMRGRTTGVAALNMNIGDIGDKGGRQ